MILILTVSISTSIYLSIHWVLRSIYSCIYTECLVSTHVWRSKEYHGHRLATVRCQILQQYLYSLVQYYSIKTLVLIHRRGTLRLLFGQLNVWDDCSSCFDQCTRAWRMTIVFRAQRTYDRTNFKYNDNAHVFLHSIRTNACSVYIIQEPPSKSMDAGCRLTLLAIPAVCFHGNYCTMLLYLCFTYTPSAQRRMHVNRRRLLVSFDFDWFDLIRFRVSLVTAVFQNENRNRIRF